MSLFSCFRIESVSDQNKIGEGIYIVSSAREKEHQYLSFCMREGREEIRNHSVSVPLKGRGGFIFIAK